MLRHIALILALTLPGFSSLLIPQDAIAQTPLTRAVIESLRNRVQLIPRNQSARPARLSDTMALGDALTTARASTAQLRFNDGSLARLGESVVFRFIPRTRTFELSNGTALLLIPPGQGRTHVRTPNAAAGIRGSALFVRYVPGTDTTIVGALTNSGIEVFNGTGSQRQELKAGHMAVIVRDRIEQIYEFDLDTFYQTSELAAGLNLAQTESTVNPDEAIAKVQAETREAVQAQSPITGSDVMENPSFIQRPASTSDDFPDADIGVIDENPSGGDRNSTFLRNDINIRSVIEAGEIQNNQSPSPFPGGGNTGGEFPGGGNTGGEFPGGGNTGGIFPGGGNTGGIFPGGGNTGGIFPGGGNTGGNFPGGGNTGGIFPGGGRTRGNFPGGGRTRGN